jgi:hypothetical protein
VISYLVAAGFPVVRGLGVAATRRVFPLAAATLLVGSLPTWLHGWVGSLATRSMWDPVGPTPATPFGSDSGIRPRVTPPPRPRRAGAAAGDSPWLTLVEIAVLPP